MAQLFTVLGATGFIGSRLAAHLRAAGHEVATPARGEIDTPALALGHAFYCIGLTAGFRSRPLETVEAHVCLLRRLLAQASFESLTYLSSTRVYAGAAASEACEDSPLRLDPNQPSDLYNLSKLMGESLCLQGGRANMRAVRLSNVVGGKSAASEDFIPALLEEARHGRITLRSDPESAKDYIHIDDVVAMLPAIALGGRHRLYNLASGIRITHRTWVEAIARHFKASVTYLPAAPRVDFPPVSIARIAAEFGFSPRPPLETCLAALERFSI